jgi:hypothetical protein
MPYRLVFLLSLVVLGLDASAAAPSSSLPVTIAHPGSVVVVKGTPRSGGPPELAADDDSYLEIGSTRGGSTTWYGKIFNVPRNISALSVTYKGKNAPGCHQHFEIRHWGGSGKSEWVLLDKRAVGETEIQLDAVPQGAPGGYVGGQGEAGPVWLKVRCDRKNGRREPYTAYGDWMEIAYAVP